MTTNIFHSILENIVKYQKPYLKSGNYEDLNPLTQRKLAGDIKVNPSSVSRAIRYRTVETPFGEIPLKRFFVKESEIRKRLLKQIIAKEEKRCSDRELKEEFSLPFSRRTIAHYRKILTLPSSFNGIKFTHQVILSKNPSLPISNQILPCKHYPLSFRHV